MSAGSSPAHLIYERASAPGGRLAAPTTTPPPSPEVSARSILAILGGDRDEQQRMVETAAALAAVRGARLTLAQTCDPGRVYAWFGGDLYVPAGSEPVTAAARQLARITAAVPDDVSLTTLLLYRNCRRRLRELVSSGTYDTIVTAGARLGRGHLLAPDVWRTGDVTFM